MTKILAIVSAMLIAALGAGMYIPAGTTNTEDTEIIEEITGTVLEVTDEYILIESADGMQVQVNLHPDTLSEGEQPAEGDLIHVLYNGMMTRSLPPQINALRVGCYVRTGAVVELIATGFTLDDGMEIIQVNADASLLEGIEPGQQLKVYFNGAMTMSLPAQIGAEKIVPAQ